MSSDKSSFSSASRVPRPWRTSLCPTAHFALVKPSRSGFEGASRPFQGRIGDLYFRNVPDICPSGHTSPLDAERRRATGEAYPLTNGIAGGKLPIGNLGSGSPSWSFSAAVR